MHRQANLLRIRHFELALGCNFCWVVPQLHSRKRRQILLITKSSRVLCGVTLHQLMNFERNRL